MSNIVRVKALTETELLKLDPVLMDRELCLSTDVRKFKLGDGNHKWSELPYYYDEAPHNYNFETLKERDAMPFSIRKWGMITAVYNDPSPHLNGAYQLIFNLSTTNIEDNNNWRPLNKAWFEFRNTNTGIITASQHNLGQIIKTQAFKEVSGLWKAVSVTLTINPDNGEVSWKSNNVIEHLILILS